MGDSRRFDLFARLIKKNFNPRSYKTIADVAGGRGHLQLALREQGFKNIVTFDIRRHRAAGLNYRTMLFDNNAPGRYDLIVAMHPDEATDVVIKFACDHKIPFVVCPCCIKPTITVYWHKATYKGWIAHLRAFAGKCGFKVSETVLPMNGKNVVLIGKRR